MSNKWKGKDTYGAHILSFYSQNNIIKKKS